MVITYLSCLNLVRGNQFEHPSYDSSLSAYIGRLAWCCKMSQAYPVQLKRKFQMCIMWTNSAIFNQILCFCVSQYHSVNIYCISYLFNCNKVIFISRENSRKIKFREFLSEITDFITVEYVVLFNEADGLDTFWRHLSVKMLNF